MSPFEQNMFSLRFALAPLRLASPRESHRRTPAVDTEDTADEDPAPG